MTNQIMKCSECGKNVYDDDRFLEMVDRKGDVKGRVHEDCYHRKSLDAFYDSGVITSKLCLQAVIRKDKEPKYKPIADALDRIDEEIKRFEREAWFGGAASVMKTPEYLSRPRPHFSRIDDSIQSKLLPVRGLSGSYKGLSMLVCACAGRAMITLSRGDSEVTAITADNEQMEMMGQQGIYATEAEAKQMLIDACDWKKFKLKEDGKVGIFGF